MQTDLTPGPEDQSFLAVSSAMTAIVVFTTIDGVLCQPETGSCVEAREALDLLATRAVPVVLMSHGDAAAVQDLQHALGLEYPFICDGGACLYIPRGYFAELDGLTAGDEAWEIFQFGVRDPSRAVRLLASLYSVRGEEILTIGFGSRIEDCGLLTAVHVPIVVRQHDADPMRLLRRVPSAYVTAAVGPAGWNEAILGSAAV
jgi:predicted mannosyl-3-phosphoglycerate phosphatase (HAD superfamily)